MVRFFDKISNFKIGGLETCPRFKVALLLANLLSPADQQDCGKCNLVGITHLNSVMNKKSHAIVRVCERMMDEARGFAKKSKVDASKELGRLDSRIIYHVLGIGLKSADNKAYHNLDQIGVLFINDLATYGEAPPKVNFTGELRKLMKGIGPKGQPAVIEKDKATGAGTVTPLVVEQVETLAEAKDCVFK